MEVRIKPEAIDELVEGFGNFVVNAEEEKILEETRQKFVNYFNKNKIESL